MTHDATTLVTAALCFLHNVLQFQGVVVPEYLDSYYLEWRGSFIFQTYDDRGQRMMFAPSLGLPLTYSTDPGWQASNREIALFAFIYLKVRREYILQHSAELIPLVPGII